MPGNGTNSVDKVGGTVSGNMNFNFGNGANTVLYADAASEVVGIDVVPEHVEIARDLDRKLVIAARCGMNEIVMVAKVA